MPDSFEVQVRQAYGSRCGVCGSTDRTRVRLVVPEAAGGTKTRTNAILICRSCEFHEMRSRVAGSPVTDKTLLNVWVSAELHQWMQDHAPFQGVSALARYLIGLYVDSEPSRFDDLLLYQIANAEVRTFVWVPTDLHAAFKVRAGKDGLTLTQALIALVLLYRIEIAQEASVHHD